MKIYNTGYHEYASLHGIKRWDKKNLLRHRKNPGIMNTISSRITFMDRYVVNIR